MPACGATAARRPLREGLRADHQARAGREDQRPLDLPRRSRCAADSKDKLGKPNEFGYVTQIAELTPNTKRGARGLIVPASTRIGNPGENQLLPATVEELKGNGLSPKEVALDGGFTTTATSEQLEDLKPERVFIAGRQQPGSRRTQRRLQRYRTGAEGRISHLKRGYGLRRSRLKGDEGQQIWTGWTILAYNLDTLTIRSA